jgi:multiple sugar transport system substrate-binding protein
MNISFRRVSLLAIATAVVLIGSIWSVQARTTHSPVTITVAFQQFGPPPYYEAQWWHMVQARLAKTNPNIHLKLLPVVASEGDYYTKIDLMMKSAKTAPDIVREDSFLVGSDATAGYLEPLDKYLASWSEYKREWFPKMRSITTFKGHNYAIMNGTDDRLIWYNKHVFKRAGLPLNWQPHSWADILKAARTIKAKVPNVIPMNLYSGIPNDEASTMQGFEMLLYGTKDPLFDYKTRRWIISSKGFLDSLTFVQQVYNPRELLGPPNDISLSPQTGLIVTTKLFPSDKLGIDIDGSWLPNTWYPTGSHPWPQWRTVMGHAKMPTEFGQAPHWVTLSGGWAYAISAKSAHKAEAFQVLKIANSKSLLAWYDVHIANLSPRKDVLTVPSYRHVPLNTFFTNLLKYTFFRPAFPEYPRISNQIDLAMENVMSGMKPQDAMAAYAQAVTGIVGKSHVEIRH